MALIVELISKIKGNKIYREISEAPTYIKGKIKESLSKFVNRFFDGFIVISDGIRHYFSEREDHSFFYLPILVDLSRFEVLTPKSQDNYFFYCSGGNLERDGFLDSVKAFIEFHKKHSEYYLYVATRINVKNSYDCEVKKYIDENSTYIKYLGELPTTEIPQWLKGAAGLLLTPHKEYVTRGFPTKLGEYLASRNPVICTAISDIKEVLDEECCIMVPPGNQKKICEAMCTIAENPELGIQIGNCGYQFAKKNFTIDTYCRDLMCFLGL